MVNIYVVDIHLLIALRCIHAVLRTKCVRYCVLDPNMFWQLKEGLNANTENHVFQ